MIYVIENRKIVLSVSPHFNEDLSDPENFNFIWFYEIYIENKTKKPITLMTKNIEIYSSDGNKMDITNKDIEGSTVPPMEIISFISQVNLRSSAGLISGNLIFIQGRNHFVAELPNFWLDSPQSKKITN